MKNLKRIFSFLLCFVVLITAFTVQTSAFAVTVASGTYVAYSILVAALAACGVAVASTSVSPGTFQAILDSPGAEDVKALIGATAILANSGSTYFHWTASEWSTFTSWVTGSGILSGNVVVPAYGGSSLITDFNPNSIGSYAEPFILTNGNGCAWQINNMTLQVKKRVPTSSYLALVVNLQPLAQLGYDVYLYCGNSYFYTTPTVAFGSAFYMLNGTIRCNLGTGIDSNGDPADSLSNTVGVVGMSTPFQVSPDQVYINGSICYIDYYNNTIRGWYNRHYFTIAPTVNYPVSYSTVTQYMTDVINSGSLLGDWSGIGDDVINPADDTQDVGIDVYPPIAIPNGKNALPLDLGQGESIDIPLDPYLDRQTVSPGQDVIISNPIDWTDTVIDNGPDVVQPEVKVNPTTDVPPGTVDVPWSDEQTWPVAYPQTQTGELEESPPWEEAPPTTQNKPRENTNRMKLSAIWLSKFPFCIPWDLKQGVSQLLAPAEAPTFDIPFKNARLNIDETIHIDFSQYESVASVSRWFFSACWVIILIMLTKKMIWK